ncbi:MAG TPA: SDR family NAD(P)-dependent oxidoreductase [Acidobacteriaceae bacterium]|nr:SDR family NAD(P)-dependent oxidoreductase [Acidobacteriaceae bacterium]
MRIVRKPIFLASAAVAGAATGVAIAGTVATVGAAVLIARALRTKPIPDNAVVVITGGSRGLGFAIASRFARKPVRLVLAARDRAELVRAQGELIAMHPHLSPQNFYLVAADLTVRAECERLIRETVSHFDRIDVLINNAGVIQVGPIEAQSLRNFERAMQLHFFAALYTTWAALPHMRAQTPLAGWERRAAIVNIASIGGKIAVPHLLPYTASKFALVGFSEGLHAEVRHKGIRVTTVCPGLMRTGGEDHAEFLGDSEAEEKWFKFGARTPIVATSARHAACRIYSAVASGRAEITITPQAWIIARKNGLCPETVQYAASLANRYVLPKPPRDGEEHTHYDPSLANDSVED